MGPDDEFPSYSGQGTYSSHCGHPCNKAVKMNTGHGQGKENLPMSVAGPSSSQSYLSKPSSPTVHGLIQLHGKAVKGHSNNNFNVKVCNCKDTRYCDHQVVSILTDDRPNFGNGSYLHSNAPPHDFQNCNYACTCTNSGKTNRSGASMSKCDSCCCLNKLNKGYGRFHCEASDLGNKDVSSNDSNHRWKLPTVDPQEASLVDMGVSMLSSASLTSPLSLRNMDSEQSSNNYIGTGCCDGSVIKESSLSSADFFVYKRRRIETPSAPNPFEMLIPDAVLHIFRWLPKSALVKCAQVCKRFYPLALDSSLWRRLDLNGRVIRPGVLGRIVLRGCQYLRLSKGEVSGAVFSPGLQHLPAFEASLLYLDLSMAVMQPDIVAELLSACTRLKKVSLEFLRVNEAVMRALARNPNLDTLNMSMCSGVPSGALGELVARSRQLTQLNLAWTGLQNRGLDYLVEVLPTNLESLNLSGCRHYLNDTHIEHIVKRLTKLTCFDVSDSTELTSQSIKSIITMPVLSDLGVSRCYSIHSEAFMELRRVTTLAHVTMFGVADDTVLRQALTDAGLKVNQHPFSTVARPTVGVRRTSIWTARVRDA